MIAVLTDPAVGGTFVTWSLHYLSGAKEYFSTKSNSWQPLTENPLTGINAHNFIANQPLTAEEFDTVFNTLKATATGTFHSLYIHNFLHTTESFDPALKLSIDKLQDHTKKIIVVSNSSALYQAAYQSRAGSAHLWNSPEQVTQDADDIFNDFVDYFFKDSKDKWNKLALTDIWDQREFIALNFNFDKTQHIKPNISTDVECYNIDTMDLFNTFDTSVFRLFDYLGLSVVDERWSKWQTVYQQWRKQHYNRLQFTWYFDTIINGILSGEDFDLTRFDLDIVQEAAIQNRLIRRHNLNLKTWQLDKFTNTLQLHNLLETNQHTK